MQTEDPLLDLVESPAFNLIANLQPFSSFDSHDTHCSLTHFTPAANILLQRCLIDFCSRKKLDIQSFSLLNLSMVLPLLARQGRQSSPFPSSSCAFKRLFTAKAQDPANNTQAYISRSRDPFVNLSIEHRLLQITPPESTVLFLYVNAPCVVFGRNQNPWMEVNLPRLAQFRADRRSKAWKDEPIQLVRRRSGGGTVFHDDGNVNFSVVCPPSAFDRDKHAEMIVRALGKLGKKTWVNQRHDIVTAHEGQMYKISGSAYKLTRLRSLHHGTCLLNSPDLPNISGLLRSPAEPFIKTRGVDSVRSRVRNIDIVDEEFVDEVVREFKNMYGNFGTLTYVDDSALEEESIRKGYDELKSRDWIYGQTPRFAFSTHPYKDDQRERPQLPFKEKIYFESRHGVIDKFTIDDTGSDLDFSALENSNMYNVHDWSSRFAGAGLSEEKAKQMGEWMDGVLGVDYTKLSA